MDDYGCEMNIHDLLEVPFSFSSPHSGIEALAGLKWQVVLVNIWGVGFERRCID